MIFQLQITPPPGKLKLRQILALCDFSSADYPPPPKLKLSQILPLCDFPVADYPPPPGKLKLRQILALCDFSSADYPPPSKICNYGRSSQWESMCGKLPHVETLSNPDNYSFVLQKREKRKHESILTENLLHVLQYLNQFLPKEHAIKYIGFDMARVSKKYVTVFMCCFILLLPPAN